MQRKGNGKAQVCSGDHGQINQAPASKRKEICQESHIREGLECWAKEAQWEAVTLPPNPISKSLLPHFLSIELLPLVCKIKGTR